MAFISASLKPRAFNFSALLKRFTVDPTVVDGMAPQVGAKQINMGH